MFAKIATTPTTPARAAARVFEAQHQVRMLELNLSALRASYALAGLNGNVQKFVATDEIWEATSRALTEARAALDANLSLTS